MKFRHLISCLLGMIFLSGSTSAQTLRRWYSLDDRQAVEYISYFNGTLHGTAQNHVDRFGKAERAVKLGNNAYFSIPSLFSNFNYQQNGFTVSFWVYIDESIAKRQGKTPWLDSDPIVRAFFAKNGQTPMLGFYRRADRAVIDRYTPSTSSQMKNWNIWYWDPINFTQRVGWYQIFLTQEKGRGFIYVFYPNGQVESAAHYFGLQNMDQATSWGIGNDSGLSLILDEFKVYEGCVDEKKARDLNSQEAPPRGMYKISLKAADTKFIHTAAHSTESEARLEILSELPDKDLHVYKWVVTPVPNKPNIYTIRMAYENKYIHVKNNDAKTSAFIDLYEYDAQYARYYEWLIEEGTDGCFFITSNANRDLYLHTAGHYTSEGAKLELLDYRLSYARTYQWRFHLIKTSYELQKNKVIPDVAYDVVLSDNAFDGLMINLPVSQTGTITNLNRGPYPSLLTYWKFHRTYDDSYRIYSAPQPQYNLHPTLRSVSSGAVLQAIPYFSQFSSYYNFVLEKPNKYGRRVYLKPSRDQSLYVTPTSLQAGCDLTLQQYGADKPHQWALYRSERPNANKQLYDLKPGIYRIVSVADESKSITTQNHQWSKSTNLALKSTSNSRYTSHYWIVDYEYDNNGKPVLDGTYTLQLFATDKYYIKTKSNSMAISTQLEIYPLVRDYLYAQKWYIKPTRAGDGSYYIQLAGDPTKYVHLPAHSTAEDNNIELLDYRPDYASTYRWKFQTVSITAPFATSTNRVVTQKDPTKYLHVAENSTANGKRIELLSYNSTYANIYKWKFIKQDDNTFMIQNTGSQKYVRPINHVSDNTTRLEQYEYISDYAPYYKWIIAPGTAAGSYFMYLVADPTKLIHLSNHMAAEFNEVEILLYNRGYSNTYEWKLVQ